jgi:hypothetical protein
MCGRGTFLTNILGCFGGLLGSGFFPGFFAGVPSFLNFLYAIVYLLIIFIQRAKKAYLKEVIV